MLHKQVARSHAATINTYSSRPKRLVVVAFREGQQQKPAKSGRSAAPEELAVLPEQSITTRYPLPQGLDKDIPQPGG